MNINTAMVKLADISWEQSQALTPETQLALILGGAGLGAGAGALSNKEHRGRNALVGGLAGSTLGALGSKAELLHRYTMRSPVIAS